MSGSQYKYIPLNVESLLSSYPRRVDLWCVYLDMMVQTNDITTVRLVQMNYY